VQCMSDEQRTVYPVVACPCGPCSTGSDQHVRKVEEKDQSSCLPERRPVHADNLKTECFFEQSAYNTGPLLYRISAVVTSRLYSALSVCIWMSGLRDYDERAERK